MMNDAQLRNYCVQAAKELEKRMYPKPLSEEELSKRYTLPEEYETRVRGFRKAIEKKRSRKTLKAIAVLAALIALLAALALSMSAADGGVFGMDWEIVTYENGDDNYVVLNGESVFERSEEDKDFIMPSYIPEGYVYSKEAHSLPNSLVFVNGEHEFEYRYGNGVATVVISTELVEIKEKQVGDYIAYYFETELDLPDGKMRYIYLIMQTKNEFIIISGDVSVEEAFKMLESVDI